MSVRTFCQGLLLSVAAIGVSAGSVSAASGSVDKEDGVIYITGDQWRDTCDVFLDEDGDEIEIVLRVYDEDGDLDDTDTRDYDLDDVFLVVFEGFAGNDFFRNSTSVPCQAFGGAGTDTLVGGYHDDELNGGEGTDFLFGRDGDDDLYGGPDGDYLYGGADNDYLRAGTGEDEWIIAGQQGNDIFSNPGNFNWWTRTLVPVQRYVYADDFNPQEDIESLFYVPTVLTFSPIIYPITP